MLTTSFNGRNLTLCPNGRNSTIVFHGPTSKIPIVWSDPNFSTPWKDPKFNCLSKWQKTQLSAYIVQSQPSKCLAHSQLQTASFSKSSNSQDHRFWAWSHSHSSPISYLGFIMTIVIVISFARERKLYPMLCTWTKSRIVQSPIKLNYKI